MTATSLSIVLGAIAFVLSGCATAPKVPPEAAAITLVPTFYFQRDDWLRVMRHVIALNASHFNTQRMVQQYVVKACFE